MDRAALLDRSRTRGVNPVVYWVARSILQPAFHLWFGMARTGREHVPEQGPVILASNHRSFLDPFVIGMMTRRPLHFVAKRELFSHRAVAWILNSLGAFPIDRGNGDQDAMATARAILERGGAVLIFPEGSRIRPGGLGRPRRGVGRLALETGAPVVPIAISGTEDVRRGWRIRPRRVRVRAGRPLTFPRLDAPSPALALAVTDRIWPCVELQWEWLGGLPRLRRAAVLGGSPRGAGLAAALRRAGLAVDVSLTGAELDLAPHDLVCLAAPARDLPATVAGLEGRLGEHAGVLVAGDGLVAAPPEPPPAPLHNVTALPLGWLRGPAAPARRPAEHVARRTGARVACLGGPPAAEGEAFAEGATVVVASHEGDLLAQLADVLGTAGLEVHRTDDVAGVELAGAARDAALLAGADAAGAARALAEVRDYAVEHGARSQTFAGAAGAGGLGGTAAATAAAAALAVDPHSVALLARTLRADGAAAPTISALADAVARGAAGGARAAAG